MTLIAFDCQIRDDQRCNYVNEMNKIASQRKTSKMLGLDSQGKIENQAGMTYETFSFEIVSRLIFRNTYVVKLYTDIGLTQFIKLNISKVNCIITFNIDIVGIISATLISLHCNRHVESTIRNNRLNNRYVNYY